ncbi:MAG: GNAT family N-acetyltransferase [Clostridiaceae bacterium]|nr:GNAT family N-acetyltransferase [Clostridiaceae bacterium]
MIKIHEFNHEARQLLSFSPLQYMFDAVSEKPQLSEIYIDGEVNPKSCALLLGHYLFLNKAEESFITQLFATVFTEEKQKELGALIIFYDDDGTAELIKKYFRKVYDNTRSVYRYNPVQTDNKRGDTDIKRGDFVVPITEELINSDLENIEMITQEVLGTATYDNMKAFCQNGIGYTFVDQKRICAFCTSEYPSKSAVAIGIEVDAKHQRQGVATEMTQAFLKKALSRKLNVYWECWKSNEASVQTALKCGFEKVADYPVLFVDMN